MYFRAETGLYVKRRVTSKDDNLENFTVKSLPLLYQFISTVGLASKTLLMHVNIISKIDFQFN